MRTITIDHITETLFAIHRRLKRDGIDPREVKIVLSEALWKAFQEDLKSCAEFQKKEHVDTGETVLNKELRVERWD